MKIKIIPIMLMIFISIWTIPQKAVAQVSASFQLFYDDLSPYGSWVDNPAYGYVWVPRLPHSFRPYASNGHWVWTEDGWTWVSGYPWGWAPFHYGRWYDDDNYGWIWVPDDEWGPGWVSWRSSDDYYGWAPIGPGVSIELAYTNGYDLPYNRWTFVKCNYFGRSDINNYYVNTSSNVNIINNTRIINNPHTDRAHNTRFNGGPDRTEVEKHAGRTFTPVSFKESNKPAQRLANNQLEIYRPQVQKNGPGGTKPAPARVQNLKDVKRPVGNNTNNLILPKVQPAQQQKPIRNNPSGKVQPVQQQQKPVQRQRVQQPIQQQRTTPPVKQQQPVRQQRVQQPPIQQQRINPPVKQQQPVRQQPVRQQRVQQQRINPVRQQQPVRQQRVQQPPVQQQRVNPPVRQQQQPVRQTPPTIPQHPPAFQGPPQRQNTPKQQPPPPKKKDGK